MLVDQYDREIARSDGYRKMASIIEHEFGMRPQGNTDSSNPIAENVWAYACVTLTAQSWAQMPRGMWKKSTKTGGTRKGFVEIDDHPVLDLFDRPNKKQSGEDFFTQWMTLLLTYGNVWIELGERTSKGYPSELFVWGGDKIGPIRDKDTGELLAWSIKLANGRYKAASLDDFLHTRLPNPYDDVMGLPPLAAAKLSLDADKARQIYDKAFFGNNASPDAVLIYKGGHLTDEQKEQIRASWTEYHQGPHRAGGMAVLPGDFEFKQWGLSHSVTQFIQQRTFVREEVATVFGVPVNMLNAGQKGVSISKEGLSVARVTFYENAIFPKIPLFRNSFYDKIIKPIDPNLWFDFDTDKLPVMIDYLRDKALVIDTLVKNGTPLNQAFMLVDLAVDPVKGGDKGFLPGNFVPIDVLSEVKVMQPPVARPEDRPGAASGSNPSRKPQPTNKPQGQSNAEKPKQRSEDFIESISPLLGKMKSRLGRLLFTFRAECKKNQNYKDPFNRVDAQKTWVKNILPFAYSAYVCGYNPTTYSRLTSLSQVEFELFVEELVNSSEGFTLPSKVEAADLEEIVLRSTEIIDTLWDELNVATHEDDFSNNVTRVFTKIHPFAREVSKVLLTSCFNAGRYHLAVKRKDTLSVSNPNCSSNHGRFPGDPDIPFEDGFCSCILN